MLAGCFYGITGPRRGELMGLHIHPPLHGLFIFWCGYIWQGGGGKENGVAYVEEDILKLDFFSEIV